MTIEEIKELCESRTPYNDDYFGIETYRKALFIALRTLGNIHDMAPYYCNSEKVAKCSINEIEKLFS